MLEVQHLPTVLSRSVTASCVDGILPRSRFGTDSLIRSMELGPGPVATGADDDDDDGVAWQGPD